MTGSIPNDIFDAVVVGAGTAGATAAAGLAEAGLRVGLFDAQPFDRAGARWVNGVPPWMFDAAAVARPLPPERMGHDAPYSIYGPSGRRALTIDPCPVWSVDMRALVRRLHSRAAAAGVEARPGRRVVEVECRGERPRVVVFATEDGTERITADLFVDATGMNAALRRRTAAMAAICPAPARDHVCSAAQAVCKIADPDAARAWLDARGARTGEVVCRLGLFGGFSTSNLCVEGDTVDLLTGAIATSEFPSGSEILQRSRDEHPWVGEPIFGGAGAIPLRRPYDRFAVPGLALVGDAACQVFPAHGSGIGMGMIAARMLVEAVTQGADPGGESAMWRYVARFQRAHGGRLAAYDGFRRLSQTFDRNAVEALLDGGLLTPTGYHHGLDQRMPSTSPGELAATALAAIRQPRLAARLLPTVLRMAPVTRHYQRYPESASIAALAHWSSRAARFFDERPDIPR